MPPRTPFARSPVALLANAGTCLNQALESMLEPLGYRVLSVATGRELLDRAPTARPDVILMDANLHDLDSITVCRTLRQQRAVSWHTPIFMITSTPATKQQRLAALEAGAWDYLSLVINSEELALKLDAFVRVKLETDRALEEAAVEPASGLYTMRGLERRARELVSDAFRRHAPLACLAFAVELEPQGAHPAPVAAPPVAVAYAGQILQARGRTSDAIGVLVVLLALLLLRGSADQTRALRDVHERLGALGEATKRLETMGTAVTEVQQLLQVPKLRGTLGEVWLEELLRQILPASHYQMQHVFRSGERVDAALRVGDRLVPVDAKFPLEACQRLLGATGAEAEREARAFARSLKERIDEIADKYIRPDEGTYDFALMYIPAENVYYEAVLRAEDPGDAKSVLGHALRRRVIPVSPHTFYAYLLVILHGLKGMRVEQQAREIQEQLGGLRQQFAAFWAAFQGVGAHLANAQKRFEESERQAGRVQERFERITGVDDRTDPGEPGRVRDGSG